MSKSKLAVTIIPLLLVLGIALIFAPTKNQRSIVKIPMADKHRGVCWVAGPNEISGPEFETLNDHNINWISQTPFGWQNGHDNPEINTIRDFESKTNQTWWGERDEGVRITASKAKAAGIQTILKPHIWLNDSSGKWRGEIKMKSEEDWKKWFEEYSDFILPYAKLAEEVGIEMLCIGTELHQTCIERDSDWRKLIAQIRNVYSGPLTYAANFSEEYKDISFWDELDYIGIQAYFPLVDQENPTLEQIKEGWKKPIEELSRFSNKYEKPILFTEVGYKSTKDSGIEPWKWPERLSPEAAKAIHSEETQAHLYEALFSEVWDQPWLAGFHFWKWYPNRSRSRRNPSALNTDFTPQNKEAEQVMGKWFNKVKR